MMDTIQNILDQDENVLDWGVVPFRQIREKLPHSRELQSWIDQGYHGQMDFMANTQTLRQAPLSLAPWAQSAVLFLYKYPEKLKEYDSDHSNPKIKISSYCQGPDYHHQIIHLCNQIENALKINNAEIILRSFADAQPVFERDLAVLAGLGWTGKNTVLIHKKWGSSFFIGGFFINKTLEPRYIPQEDFCGKCTACLNECPTHAFVKVGVLDANKCISYLTIEKKDEIEPALAEKFSGWIYGCDICQQVCPWNHKHLEKESDLKDKQFSQNFEIEMDPWVWLEKLKQGSGFNRMVKGTALSRGGRKKLMRNVLIYILNHSVSSELSKNKLLLIDVQNSETDEILIGLVRKVLKRLDL